MLNFGNIRKLVAVVTLSVVGSVAATSASVAAATPDPATLIRPGTTNHTVTLPQSYCIGFANAAETNPSLSAADRAVWEKARLTPCTETFKTTFTPAPATAQTAATAAVSGCGTYEADELLNGGATGSMNARGQICYNGSTLWTGWGPNCGGYIVGMFLSY
ncbi:MAG TPA: hypothetical protein VH134_09715, partial [Candidatus Dormibacteraeota bacterium]|nr:hypothetical protein [Candidatus Dormibacteraeota bacterium]